MLALCLISIVLCLVIFVMYSYAVNAKHEWMNKYLNLDKQVMELENTLNRIEMDLTICETRYDSVRNNYVRSLDELDKYKKAIRKFPRSFQKAVEREMKNHEVVR